MFNAAGRALLVRCRGGELTDLLFTAVGGDHLQLRRRGQPHDTASGAPTTTSYNSLNQTTAEGPLTFTYAGTGQSDRVSSSDSSSGGQAYTFTQSLLGLTTRNDTTDGSSSTYTRDSTGNLISTITGSGTEDYLTDGLGSVVATVNSSGAIDQRYAYKPFGLLATTNKGIAAAKGLFRSRTGEPSV